MGIYSLVLLFLGILVIGLVYAKTDNNRISHHFLFAIILSLFLLIFFSIHHHFEKSCAILFAGNLDQIVGLIRSWGFAAPLMSLILMILQAIVAPLPAFLVTAANGMVFGHSLGGIFVLDRRSSGSFDVVLHCPSFWECCRGKNYSESKSCCIHKARRREKGILRDSYFQATAICFF